jgi:hypothetical protein
MLNLLRRLLLQCHSYARHYEVLLELKIAQKILCMWLLQAKAIEMDGGKQPIWLQDAAACRISLNR